MWTLSTKHRQPYRRAGVRITAQGVTIDETELTNKQRQALETDPLVVITASAPTLTLEHAPLVLELFDEQYPTLKVDELKASASKVNAAHGGPVVDTALKKAELIDAIAALRATAEELLKQ